MKAHAFGALFWNDVVHFVGNRLEALGGVHLFALVGDRPAQVGSVFKRPLYAGLVDGVVGAFRFASPAIDAFVGYDDGHMSGLYGGSDFCTMIKTQEEDEFTYR